MPLDGIDEPSARLKQKAPKGYPTRLHKWWAQTPVSAARAVLFAQLVDDPPRLGLTASLLKQISPSNVNVSSR